MLLGTGTKLMRRREFFTLLGGVATAWPLAARAQQPAMPMVGFVGAGAAGPNELYVASLTNGLKSTGYIVGQNVSIGIAGLKAITSNCLRWQPNWWLAM